MAEKRKFKVVVTELLRKVVIVEAFNEAEAHQRASDAWQNGEVMLDGRDFDGAEFYVQGEAGSEDGKNLEELEGKDPEVEEDGVH